MQKSKRYLKEATSVFLISVLFFSCGQRQPENKIPANALVTVGSRYMMPEDFTHRLRFTPHQPLKGMTLPTKRELYLNPLIDEALFANAASSLNLDTNRVYRLKLREIKKDYVREQLYKKEIGDTTHITQAQLRTALFRSQHQLTLDYLPFETKKEAQYAEDLIKSGEATFDEVVSILDTVSAKAPHIDVRWGQLIPSIEDTVYNLKQGETTGIIETPSGYLIMRLDTTKQVIPSAAKSPEELVGKVRQVIKERLLDAASSEYIQNIMRDIDVKVNQDGVEVLEQYVKAHQPMPPSDSLQQTTTDDKEIRQLFGYSSQQLDKPLVNFGDHEWTIREFLEIVYARGVSLPDKTKPVPPWIKNTLGEMMRDEVLADEGFQQHLDTTATVRHQVNRWDNFYSSQLYADYLLQNFSNDSAYVSVVSQKLDSLSTAYPPQIDYKTLHQLPVDNTEMIAVKRGNPTRLAVPPYPNSFLQLELSKKDSLLHSNP